MKLLKGFLRGAVISTVALLSTNTISMVAFAAAPPVPVPGKVRVYLYRPRFGVVTIYVDQTLIAKFKWPKDGKYYQVADLDPGRHFFYAGADVKHGITVTLTPEREYFVSCHDESVAFAPRHSCTLVDPEQGKSDIEKLTFKGPKEK